LRRQVVALLVRRCIAGDAGPGRKSYSDIIGGFTTSAIGFAGSADDAQDLTQEVFIKILSHSEFLRSGARRIHDVGNKHPRNLLVDHFRKSKQDRLTDSLDAGASEHEEAQPLSEQIKTRLPHRRKRAASRNSRNRSSGVAEAITGTAGGSGVA